jgi:hypothetical protein
VANLAGLVYAAVVDRCRTTTWLCPRLIRRYHRRGTRLVKESIRMKSLRAMAAEDEVALTGA